MISSISPLLGLFVVYKASTNVHIKLQSKRRGNSLLIGKISNLTTEKETHKMQDRVSSSENHSFESYDETMLLSMSKDCPDHIIKCGLTADWNEFHLVSKSAADLSSNDKNLIYQLFEDNMKTWYLKNWGLNVIEKKKELYNPNSRFICVYKSATLTNTPSTESSVPEIKSSTDVSSENELVAFAMFRFEWDDEDEPEHPVLFCYEIQICDTYRGQKIGRKVSLP